MGWRGGTSRAQRAAKPSCSAGRASRSWSRASYGVSPANASMGKKTPTVSRPGAIISPRIARELAARYLVGLEHHPSSEAGPRGGADGPTSRGTDGRQFRPPPIPSPRRNGLPDIQIETHPTAGVPPIMPRTGHGEGRIRSRISRGRADNVPGPRPADIMSGPRTRRDNLTHVIFPFFFFFFFSEQPGLRTDTGPRHVLHRDQMRRRELLDRPLARCSGPPRCSSHPRRGWSQCR